MSIQSDLSELVEANIISSETATRIEGFYASKSTSGSRLMSVFAILGALLIGLGIILILAHNWDDLSRSTKTIFAFLHLLIGQALMAFALFRKNDSTAWREGSGVFLFLAIGSSMSLVSQIYNIPGNLSSLLITWGILAIPIIYLLRSSVTSLLYIIAISVYANELAYWAWPHGKPYMYLVMMALLLPFYGRLWMQAPKGNFTVFHHWFVAISLAVSFGTMTSGSGNGELMMVAYMSLFGLFLALGHDSILKLGSTFKNGYRMVGTLGTVGMLLAFSFDEFWESIRNRTFDSYHAFSSFEGIAAVALTLLTLYLLYRQWDKTGQEVRPIQLAFAAFIIIFTLGIITPIASFLVNLLVMALGIFNVIEGNKKDHLGILNSGLVFITALITCRFFDSDLSFIIRGLLFVAVGVGFFLANYLILKKRKQHEA
jgi:uncharacterized membrane protein